MPFKSPKKKKEYNKKYYWKNRKRLRFYNKKWYQKNKDKVKEYQERNRKKIQKLRQKYRKEHTRERKDYQRATRLMSGGKQYRVIKRPYPKNQKCEVCEKVKQHLEYHHWEEIKKGKFVKGIWVCHLCHQYITLMELNPNYPQLFQKYLKLKEKINETSPIT